MIVMTVEITPEQLSVWDEGGSATFTVLREGASRRERKLFKAAQLLADELAGRE